MPRVLKSRSVLTSFNMNKKYEFTGVEKNGLKQIRRIADGLVGGWIQSEKNLSQEGDCFVYDNAKVFGNTMVCGNAKVSGNSVVFGDVVVTGNADKPKETSGSASDFLKNLPESVTSITIDGIVYVRKNVWEKL